MSEKTLRDVGRRYKDLNVHKDTWHFDRHESSKKIVTNRPVRVSFSIQTTHTYIFSSETATLASNMATRMCYFQVCKRLRAQVTKPNNQSATEVGNNS